MAQNALKRLHAPSITNKYLDLWLHRCSCTMQLHVHIQAWHVF